MRVQGACLAPRKPLTLPRMGRRPQRPRRDEWRPIRATREWSIDQIFLRRSGGRIVANVSLVSLENELRTEKVFPPTGEPFEAIRIIAREMARKGNVSRANSARVRWAQPSTISEQDELSRDETLEHAFVKAFDAALDDVRDRMR
jgi:hypothetical protein